MEFNESCSLWSFRDPLYNPTSRHPKRMSLNLADYVQRRQLSGRGYPSLRHRIRKFTSNIYDEFPSNASATGLEIGYESLPLTCRYSNNYNSGQCLAVADEDGYLAFYDTKTRICDGPKSLRRAHDNAIFDIEWTEDDQKIITASGDHSSIVWDVETMEFVAIFKAHSSSVKAVTTLDSNNHIFASSGRDGSIMVFDTRCTAILDDAIGHTVHRPVNVIPNAHVPLDAIKGLKVSKKKMDQAAQSFSVTSVKFLDSSRLVSAGAADGVVKLWDIRVNGFYSKKKFPVSADNSIPSGTCARKYGITSLTLSPDKCSIFASCTDNHIYQFNSDYLKAPINSFSASSFKCDSFFIRNSISPDGRFLCSGSSDGNLHIWEVDLPLHSPFQMSGYDGEITGVSWSSGELDQLASCSDDRKVRIWRYSHESLNKNPDESLNSSNPYIVNEAKESPKGLHHAERYYSDSHNQENVSPKKTTKTKSNSSTPSSIKKRTRRISDYFSPRSNICDK